MGYCGGKKENPSYYSLGDHTEAISIDYDPSAISYDDLLQRFWRAHRCGSTNYSRQYMNAVFYRNDDQKKQAEASLIEEAARLGLSVADVETKIVPMGTFTYAEGYHQKYALTRHREVRQFLNQIYPDAKSFADSTVATRLNAYLSMGLARHREALEQALPSYGLPDTIEKAVKRAAGLRGL